MALSNSQSNQVKAVVTTLAVKGVPTRVMAAKVVFVSRLNSPLHSRYPLFLADGGLRNATRSQSSKSRFTSMLERPTQKLRPKLKQMPTQMRKQKRIFLIWGMDSTLEAHIQELMPKQKQKQKLSPACPTSASQRETGSPKIR